MPSNGLPRWGAHVLVAAAVVALVAPLVMAVDAGRQVELAASAATAATATTSPDAVAPAQELSGAAGAPSLAPAAPTALPGVTGTPTVPGAPGAGASGTGAAGPSGPGAAGATAAVSGGTGATVTVTASGAAPGTSSSTSAGPVVPTPTGSTTAAPAEGLAGGEASWQLPPELMSASGLIPAVTVTVTVPGAAAPFTAPVTAPVTAAAPTSGGTVPAPLPAGVSTGWHSGASGAAATNGAFGTWRGKPVQVIAVWGDTSAEEQTALHSLDELSGFGGDVDIAVGALAPGETWAQAAQGTYAARWRQAIRSMAARRGNKPGVTYVRFAHEMNGDWYTWRVNSGNLAAFHASWRMYHDILAQEFPAARLVFSPNNGNHSDLTVSQIYPGDDVVDVIGVDFYDGWPNILDQAGWNAFVNTTEQGGQPVGPGAWQAFAAAHDRPLSFPEWGLQFGDHPAFITAMHDFLVAFAARPGETSVGGKVIYDVYFDIAHGGNTGFMLSGSANPQSAAVYRSLSWGT